MGLLNTYCSGYCQLTINPPSSPVHDCSTKSLYPGLLIISVRLMGFNNFNRNSVTY